MKIEIYSFQRTVYFDYSKYLFWDNDLLEVLSLFLRRLEEAMIQISQFRLDAWQDVWQ